MINKWSQYGKVNYTVNDVTKYLSGHHSKLSSGMKKMEVLPFWLVTRGDLRRVARLERAWKFHTHPHTMSYTSLASLPLGCFWSISFYSKVKICLYLWMGPSKDPVRDYISRWRRGCEESTRSNSGHKHPMLIQAKLRDTTLQVPRNTVFTRDCQGIAGVCSWRVHGLLMTNLLMPLSLLALK